MPRINEYRCSKCDLSLPKGWGYYFYVENDKGERIVCYHPRERYDVKQVLGERASLLEVVRERTGFNSHCICLDCLHQFQADLGGSEMYWSPYELYLESHLPRPKQAKDKRQCPKCKSTNVKTELELVGQTCPKCKEGVIEEVWTERIS
jgi:predicted RNA-binding Zn-ribbon protein involved in translation (DUF1610 family)